MFPRYGKQVLVRSEWNNLSRYTSMSITARLLWIIVNQQADKHGNVDLDPDELALRMSLPSVDMKPFIKELVACKHIRTYEAEEDGRTYGAIEGYTTTEHPNRQQAHKKSEAKWENPRPPWMPELEIVNAELPRGVRRGSAKPIQGHGADKAGGGVRPVVPGPTSGSGDEGSGGRGRNQDHTGAVNLLQQPRKRLKRRTPSPRPSTRGENAGGKLSGR